MLYFISEFVLEPIPSFLRPEKLEDFVGQEHLVGEGKTIRIFLENEKVPSMIFWGPPGVGKTTLALIISKVIKADFYQMSGVTSKKDDLKKIIEQAKLNTQYGKQTIVFLDEIHRRNKAQQDTLLPYVENGNIILIGATTENPSFTINNALLSRSRVFVFEKLEHQDILMFLKKNLKKIQDKYKTNPPDPLYKGGIEISDENLELISKLGNGDLRNSLNILESAILIRKKGEIIEEDILKAGQKAIYFDRNGEEHYNIISAIHKSLRDSDGNAACYRIQRMLMGGEDPLYIVRRMLRFASEDIGLADNNALLLANQVYDAIAKIGMPECDVFIFQLAMYLAKAKKDNTAYKVALATKADVTKYGNLDVPIHLRNAPTKFMKEIGYGKGYKYFHDDNSAKDQQHLPDELKGRKYF
ncbi:replication-associated recombination protein A [Candidatus Gracilibacteria bacterium]|nr:replication-associated recombination protein A [Candidatus Gracilibacteria bacterium]